MVNIARQMLRFMFSTSSQLVGNILGVFLVVLFVATCERCRNKNQLELEESINTWGLQIPVSPVKMLILASITKYQRTRK